MVGRTPIFGMAGLVLAAVACLLTACGGGGGGDCGSATVNAKALMYSVPSLVAEGNYYGVTEYVCSGPTLVRISRETPGALVPRVIAHEMLHTAGLVEHEASPECHLYRDAFPGQDADPCLSEIDRLREVVGTIEIAVPDPTILADARECALMWNGYAGRDVFVIVDQTPPGE